MSDAPGESSVPGAIAAVESERAELYGLLARLFSAPPDAPLLAMIAGSAADLGGAGTALGRAWAALRDAARAADPHAQAIVFGELFLGVGRARVSVYASHYLAGAGREHPLVALRDRLAELGLARRGGVTQPEDHVAGLLEVMRHLCGRGDDAAALAGQRRFFGEFLDGWFERFSDELAAAPDAGLYCAAAGLLREFLRIERTGFALGT